MIQVHSYKHIRSHCFHFWLNESNCIRSNVHGIFKHVKSNTYVWIVWKKHHIGFYLFHTFAIFAIICLIWSSFYWGSGAMLISSLPNLGRVCKNCKSIDFLIYERYYRHNSLPHALILSSESIQSCRHRRLFFSTPFSINVSHPFSLQYKQCFQLNCTMYRIYQFRFPLKKPFVSFSLFFIQTFRCGYIHRQAKGSPKVV